MIRTLTLLPLFVAATSLSGQQSPAPQVAAVEPGPAAKAAAPVLRSAATVAVTTDEQRLPDAVSTTTVSGQALLDSAGTFQDLPRFLQTLPGVVSGSDVQNALVVRGGSSTENLFVLDRIEVPNINHIALAGSSGGLGSMLDPNDIASVTFSSAAFPSDLQTHLSSVVDIHTRELPRQPTYTVDAGYTGAGVRISRSMGLDKTLLLSARESVTNLVTSDVGLNGSPEFTNSFAKFAWDASSHDHVWVESLFGRDRLKVVPTWDDAFETFAMDTTYSGWRDTGGLVWQHNYANRQVGTWTLSNAHQQQNLDQIDQITGAQLFQQNDTDNDTTARYEQLVVSASGSSASFGADTRINGMNYSVAQPNGVYSPYNGSPLPQDAFSTQPLFTTLDRAVFAESNLLLHQRVSLQTGMRVQMWGYHPGLLQPAAPGVAVPSYRASMPHASLSLLVTRRLNLRASAGRYADLPDYSVLASLPANASLGLIHSDQFVLGATGHVGRLLTLGAEAYRKTYKGYPVSTDAPTVSLANVLPTINEPFLLMALTSQGRGRVQGVELTGQMTRWHGVEVQSNATFSRALYSGLDGVYRPGNFDFPFVWNTTASLGRDRTRVTVRNTASSGRPYTPALEPASFLQNRLIYDLTQVNALRGNLYNRLDLAVNRDFQVRGRTMNLHAGALNVLNRSNFYTEAWRPRCTGCGPVDEQQMGLVPDFGASYSF